MGQNRGRSPDFGNVGPAQDQRFQKLPAYRALGTDAGRDAKLGPIFTGGAMVTSVVKLLTEVADPELPFLNIVELGIVRDAEFDGATLHITITPTYFGCPAMYAIEDSIRFVLHDKGFKDVVIQTAFAPAWTTDWLSDETKQKLKA